ncbi:MAG: hypothetical protein CML66_12280 [Rhodobacteraceae bacterium]|nr:hypothetical protein [Paracoccaceae bacterium]
MFSSLRFLKWRIGHPQRDRLRRDVISWIATRPDDPELQEVAAFLEKNAPTYLPYDFACAQQDNPVHVELDRATGLPVIDHGGKRLYWREGRKTKRIPRDYNALLAEQDPRSPHRYLTGNFDIAPGDVLVDAGSAEGILTLDVIDRVGHAYLFEADPRWTRALEATFAPWKDKVTIVPKYVGDETRDDMVRLDDYFGPERRIDFLKLDVEGWESRVLEGAREMLTSGRVARAAVCAYHYPQDEEQLSALLRDMGFDVETSDRYMLLYRDEGLAPPYLRRGLLRATRPERAERAERA